MSSIVEVHADPNICLVKRCKGIYCYFGRENLPGCPFHQVPKILESNRYCSTCGKCLKACPNDAISVHLRHPGYEFSIQKKEMLENSLVSIAVRRHTKNLVILATSTSQRGRLTEVFHLRPSKTDGRIKITGTENTRPCDYLFA